MSQLILPRRKFLAGLAATMAMPAIVRVESLMKLPRPDRFSLDWITVPGFYVEIACGEHLARWAQMYGVDGRYPFESDVAFRNRMIEQVWPIRTGYANSQ